MIVKDCTREVELISFIEEQQPTARSGWFLDFFFRDRFTTAEKLELRKYSRLMAKPLLYQGACLPPNLIDAPEDSINVMELTWPTIKAEGKITGCDVDERRITPEGDVIPVGQQRYTEALNWEMSGILDGLRATHIAEAITLLKTGGYVLHSSDTEDLGTVDFQRAATLKGLTFVGTDAAWDNMCSRPHDDIAAIVREMAKYNAAPGGAVDIVYSEYAWEWLQAHEERQAIRADRDPMLSGAEYEQIVTFNDITFQGTTNGGQQRHWVSMAKYLDHTGAEVDVLAPGEIMIVSRAGFDGQRIFRTVSSDNFERLPEGASFFLYDGIEEYERKCRAYMPWIEEHHLMVPNNVNGAVVVQVVDPAAGAPCVVCDVCP